MACKRMEEISAILSRDRDGEETGYQFSNSAVKNKMTVCFPCHRMLGQK